VCKHVFVSGNPTPRAERRADASILHADLDSFYASVEQRDDPTLRGRPVIVGGGVVLAASYEAKSHGVRTAMGGREALRRCPGAVVVTPRMSAYAEASRAVFEVFRDTTPLVEGLSIDEAFLDVGGLGRVGGSPVAIAHGLRRAVRDRVGLPISVGVARTKFLAKVASAVSKPDGLLVVEPDRELAFLHPLPVERVWGVGPTTAAKLHEQGIRTVGDLAAVPEAALTTWFGPALGHRLHALAHGRDDRRVVTGVRRSSVGAQRALGRRAASAEAVDAALVALVDRVTRRLRDGRRVGRTVELRLRFGDYTRAARARSMPQATSETRTVLAHARSLLSACAPMIAQRGLTLVGVAVSNLDDADTVQLALPLEHRSAAGLDDALDGVRRRFGAGAVLRGTVLRHGEGLAVPVLGE
jgi:DNA polymerase-4